KYIPTVICCFCLMIPPPTRSTLFPYTTLFRSDEGRHGLFQAVRLRCQSGRRSDQEERSAVTRKWTHRSWHFSRRHLWRASYSRRSEEHTSELQSRSDLVCRLLLEKKKAARGR